MTTISSTTAATIAAPPAAPVAFTPEAAFAAADVDGNGQLTATEFLAIAPPGGPGRGHGCHGHRPDDYRAAVQAAQVASGGGDVTATSDSTMITELRAQVTQLQEQVAALVAAISGGGETTASTDVTATLIPDGAVDSSSSS